MLNKNIAQKCTFLQGSNHQQQSNFTYISWDELVSIVSNPPRQQGTREQAKANSPVIAAHSAPAKTKEAALQHDQFTLLRLDIDDTQLNINQIEETLFIVDISSYLIHTTASHKYKGNGNRYRVYIELSQPITYQEWSALETYLSSLFLEVDDCASRPSQIMYLPFYFAGYEHLHSVGNAITREHPTFIEAMKYSEELSHQQEEKQQEAAKKAIAKPFNEKLVGAQVSIIQLIEQGYEWSGLLASYGYKRKGKAYLAPESGSGIAGAYILKSSDGKTRLYSHHSNDPCATGKAIDKLDFIATREFGGDRREAIKHIAKAYFPDAHKHNLKEWKISRLNGGK